MVANSGQPALMRLICFSCPGSDPQQTLEWASDLDDHIELVSVCLPGHGSRSDEMALQEWPSLLEQTFAQLKPLLAEPHALLGHCLGGSIAYEIAKRASRAFPGQTRHLFIAGCRSPNSQVRAPRQHANLLLSDSWSDTLGHSLDVPLTALYGTDDTLDPLTDMLPWGHFTQREFELIELCGDHFFLHNQRHRLLHIINTHLGLLSR
ncbi:MAG: alpha/beta fold hydrolase [Pseudomonas sp.]